MEMEFYVCHLCNCVLDVANTFMWTIFRIYLPRTKFCKCFIGPVLLWRIVQTYRNVEFTLKGTVRRDSNQEILNIAMQFTHMSI
jgi:hypothetical protein